MTTSELKRIKVIERQKEKLKQMVESERAKCKGYEELAKLHSAYITILLHKLNATEDNTVTITKGEIRQAMDNFEARAYPDKNGGMNLYCVETKKD